MKIKQTMYINKCEGLIRNNGIVLSNARMDEFNGWQFLGAVDIEFDAPELTDDTIAQRKIESLIEQSAKIRTDADEKIDANLEQIEYLQSKLAVGSATTADEKALIAGGCEVIKTEYSARVMKIKPIIERFLNLTILAALTLKI